MMLDLLFERETRNRLNSDTMRKKLRELAGLAEKNKNAGFVGRLSKVAEPEPVGDFYLYKAKVRLEKRGLVNPETEAHCSAIVDSMKKKATEFGWTLKHHGKPHLIENIEQFGENPPLAKRKDFILPELTESVIKHDFAGCYERDAQIRTIHAAVQTSVESDGKNLSHVLLYGQPGACKTKLTEKFRDWYHKANGVNDEDHGRVLFVDGTTMTKAGLENWLLELAEMERLPEVLVVDELEKQPMDNLLCLNGVMASGMLCKLNARRGNDRKPAKFVVIGICNDEKALQEFRNGAMWSRFTHKLPCVRPSRPLCLRILKEMCVDIPGGKQIWAQKALEFGWDMLHQRDIRQIKGHLDGRDRLLDGSWQNDYISIMKARQDELESMEKEEKATENIDFGKLSHGH